jgi:hypothetical protein
MGNKVAAKRVPADNLPEVAKEKGVTRTIRSQALMYKWNMLWASKRTCISMVLTWCLVKLDCLFPLLIQQGVPRCIFIWQATKSFHAGNWQKRISNSSVSKSVCWAVKEPDQSAVAKLYSLCLYQKDIKVYSNPAE